MAKKKINTGLTNSKDKKLPVQKKTNKKTGKVDHLSPKAKNKDSLTDNIRNRSGVIKDSSLGKIQTVPLSQNLKKPKKSKK